MRKTLAYITLILFLSFSVSSNHTIPIIQSNTNTELKSVDLTDSQEINDIIDTKYFNNQTFIDGVIQFLDRSQDKGGGIQIMDDAYYTGNSLRILENSGYIINNTIKDEVFNFINKNRNENGGYSNWENSTTAMESTYQAIYILDTYGLLEEQSISFLNQTLSFIQSLQAENGGYYPLPNWNLPDITSSYRALWIKQKIKQIAPSLLIENDNLLGDFIYSQFVPRDINTPEILGAGYSEEINSTIDLLATYYAIATLDLLDLTDPNIIEVTKYLTSLTSLNGGVRHDIYSTNPTTGYTLTGIQLFLLLKSPRYNSAEINATINANYHINAVSFIRSNFLPGGGFGATSSDSTAEYSSTYFALRAFELVPSSNILQTGSEIPETISFINFGLQPTFGIGNYPGDIPDLTSTTYAILSGKMLGDTSWINSGIQEYIINTYDETAGGFGFRPGAEANVKYTYYGIRLSRLLELSFFTTQSILEFLHDSQNYDGGFGENPRSILSYLTHTYWALESMKLLGSLQLDVISPNQITNFLDVYRLSDGTFVNFPGFNPSLVSTFRGINILNELNYEIPANDPLNDSLLQFKADNGFTSRINYTIPTMQDTFYGVSLQLFLNQEVNYTQILEFVGELLNMDGGFRVRRAFSSRVSSTFWALSLLQLLKNNQVILNEDQVDFFAPLIYPSFNPTKDTNITVQGVYLTYAEISDPEGEISQSWIEIQLISNVTNQIQRFNVSGEPTSETNIWFYQIGPYPHASHISFKLYALDTANNVAYTEWFQINIIPVQDINETGIQFSTTLLLWILPFILVSISLIYAYKSNKKINQLKRSEIKLKIIDKQTTEYTNENLHIFYLFLLMTIIAIIARIFIGDALIVLENSIFLFRFLLAAIVIIVARYFVGIKTYGFFGTSVLALSWFAIGPVFGLLMFLNLFILTYTVRRIIDPLNLSVGFRVGISMMFVVCTMALLEILGEIFAIQYLSTTILIPIIITPWIVDRYHKEEVENNSYEAFKRLVFTILVISFSYLIMSIEPLVRFIIFNPETWIIFIAILVYLGKNQNSTYFDRKRFVRLFQKEDTPLTLLYRNRDYIARYNDYKLFPIINKFNLKEQFDLWKVPTAALFAVINSVDQVDKFVDQTLKEEKYKEGFVIKPSSSYGGKGIVVVKGKDSFGNYLIGSHKYDPIALKDHIQKIILGEFLTSQTSELTDVVLIEERIIPDNEFGSISQGLADIRLIIFRGIPVMAMARIPTIESKGLANLKQGAIGAAISIKDGTITRAEYKQNEVTIHPDTKKPIIGFKFHNWNEILMIGCLSQKSTGLGYAGVDLVLDVDNRVLVLEVNKRPGLEIQNINLKGLISRLSFIEENNLDAIEKSPAGAARLAIKIASEHWENEL